jgi:hypothetical protein
MDHLKHGQINTAHLFMKRHDSVTGAVDGCPSFLAVSMIGPHLTWYQSQFLLAAALCSVTGVTTRCQSGRPNLVA